MSAEQYEEVKQKFSGSWKLDRSENFEEFLGAVGVNFFVRKMANLSKPTSEISVQDGQITICLNSSFMKKTDVVKLGEEFETEFMGSKIKAKSRYEDGKLITDNTPVDESMKATHATQSTRQLTEDGELLLTITIGEVICKRWFKKVPQ